MVRPSAPRFLNFGDRFELPVVLQNQTDEPMTVDVAVRASNLELTGASRPARDRPGPRPGGSALPGRRRSWPAPPASRSPPSRAAIADAATVELPVYTPATTEAFATYGVIDEGAVAQPVAAPAGRLPAVRRAGDHHLLHRAAGADRRRALPGRLPLSSAPSSIASRILAVAALRDVLTAFNADGLPSPQEMEAAVAARYRTPAGPAERRRRLPLLAARPGIDPLQHHPRRPRARTAPSPRASPSRRRCSSALWTTCARSRATTPPGTARKPAGRSAPMPSTSAT